VFAVEHSRLVLLFEKEMSSILNELGEREFYADYGFCGFVRKIGAGLRQRCEVVPGLFRQTDEGGPSE